MARFFYKCLGRFAFMTAAALWAGCGNDRAEKDAPETNSKASSEINTETKSEQVLSSPWKTKEYIKKRTENGYRNCYRGICDSLSGTLYGSGVSDLSVKARGHVKVPQKSEIEIVGGGHAETDLILRVLKQRTPGLRHIYNKHLKKNPGFNGKVVLDLTITSDGSISSAVIKSSTTNYDEFDKDVRTLVSRWKFQKSAGEATVTVPFVFSELSEK